MKFHLSNIKLVHHRELEKQIKKKKNSLKKRYIHITFITQDAYHLLLIILHYVKVEQTF